MSVVVDGCYVICLSDCGYNGTIIHCDGTTATVQRSSTAADIHCDDHPLRRYNGHLLQRCNGHPLRQSSTATVQSIATAIPCDCITLIYCNDQRSFTVTVIHCNVVPWAENFAPASQVIYTAGGVVARTPYRWLPLAGKLLWEYLGARGGGKQRRRWWW